MKSNDTSEDTEESRDKRLGNYFRRIHTLSQRVILGHSSYEEVMETIQYLLDNNRLDPFSLLPSPASQIKTARMLNSLCKWGLPEFESMFSPIQMPDKNRLRKLGPTQAPILHIGLGSLRQTCEGAWSLIEAAQQRVGYSATLDEFKSSDDPGLGLDWKIVDFGIYKDGDYSLAQARRSRSRPLATTEILWALVYNPNLLQDLWRFKINRVVMGGWSGTSVPILNFDEDSQTLEFGGVHFENKTRGHSIPVLLDYSRI